MTGNKYLLDTSIIIHSFKRIDIAKKLDELSEIFVPVIVVGELYFGAERSTFTQQHMQQVLLFLQNCTVLTIDVATAEMYAAIKASLWKKGKPIPENDIWIAATAKQHNLPLYTTDKHFSEVEEITLVF